MPIGSKTQVDFLAPESFEQKIEINFQLSLADRRDLIVVTLHLIVKAVNLI